MAEEKSDNLFSSIKRAINYGNESALSEEKGQGWSTTWDSPPSSYEKSFKFVFSQRFNSFLAERRKNTKVYALDLMSSPAMLSNLDLDGGVAVGLGEIPLESYQDGMTRKNISYVHGNLLTKQPWREIGEWLKTNGADSFDLITCRADMTGYHSNLVPRNPTVYYTLLDRAWNLLSKNGGVLLVDIPWFIYHSGIPRDQINQWMDILKQKQVEFEYEEDSAIKFVRHPNSPEHLPQTV